MTALGFPACRFDGRSAGATSVVLRVEGNSLRVETPDGALVESEPVTRAVISERFRTAPRLITLHSGATLEVNDAGGALARALQRAGLRLSPVVRLQGWWPAVVAALAGLVALMVLAYFKGLPIAAEWAADRMPPSIELRMGEQVLNVLDRHYLRPTALPAFWRERLALRFAEAAAKAAPGVQYRLEFRNAGRDRINAFALPGGIIVLLDGLVVFSYSDNEVLGVLGHELGHVAHKHHPRQLFQSVGIGILAGLLWGDFSGTAASAPIVIGMLRYSRGFEGEADEFAIRFLHLNGISAQPLQDFFSRLRAQKDRRAAGGLPQFLLTHASTDERIDRLAEETEKEQARREAPPAPGAASEESARDGGSR